MSGDVGQAIAIVALAIAVLGVGAIVVVGVCVATGEQRLRSLSTAAGGSLGLLCLVIAFALWMHGG